MAFADPRYILYGSDWPFAPEPAVACVNKLFEVYALDEATRQAIDRGNAERRFPRLAGLPQPMGQK